MVSTRGFRIGLVRSVIGRQKKEFVELKKLRYRSRDVQMPRMDRVECSAIIPDSFCSGIHDRKFMEQSELFGMDIKPLELPAFVLNRFRSKDSKLR